MDTNKQQKSSVIGCGFWATNIIGSLIALMVFWDEVIDSNYWPYLLAIWIVTLLALIWWYFIRKQYPDDVYKTIIEE